MNLGAYEKGYLYDCITFGWSKKIPHMIGLWMEWISRGNLNPTFTGQKSTHDSFYYFVTRQYCYLRQAGEM